MSKKSNVQRPMSKFEAPIECNENEVEDRPVMSLDIGQWTLDIGLWTQHGIANVLRFKVHPSTRPTLQGFDAAPIIVQPY